MSGPLVVILMGSPADREHAGKIVSTLDALGVESVQRIGCAHKTPEHVLAIIDHYEADPRPEGVGHHRRPLQRLVGVRRSRSSIARSSPARRCRCPRTSGRACGCRATSPRSSCSSRRTRRSPRRRSSVSPIPRSPSGSTTSVQTKYAAVVAADQGRAVGVTPLADAPREECGVLAMSTPHGEGVAQLAFFGLYALQHRGQEAAGIAVSDGSRARMHKDVGLVSRVFTPESLAPLSGYHAIGHTRYSTTGSGGQRNAQPFLVETMHGPLALAHNGNLVNAQALRSELLDARLRADRHQRHRGDDADARLRRRRDLGGAPRAHAAGLEGRLHARHPGQRPGDGGPRPVGLPPALGRPAARRRLGRGVRDLRAVDPRLRRDQRDPTRRDRDDAGRRDAPPPGAGPGRQRRAAARSSSCTSAGPTRCGPASNVHHVRQRLGERLAIEAGVDADVVVPVPDSSIPAAIGYSRISGVPYNDGLIKNRYIGRTFIEPSQALRERGVALKFNALGREPRRAAGGHDRRLARAGHDRRSAGQAGARRRRDRGAPAHHVPADHQRLPLRCRHGPRRRSDGRPLDHRGDGGHDRLRLARVPEPRRDARGDHRRPGRRRVVRRLLHRPLPAGCRARPRSSWPSRAHWREGRRARLGRAGTGDCPRMPAFRPRRRDLAHARRRARRGRARSRDRRAGGVAGGRGRRPVRSGRHRLLRTDRRAGPAGDVEGVHPLARRAARHPLAGVRPPHLRSRRPGVVAGPGQPGHGRQARRAGRRQGRRRAVHAGRDRSRDHRPRRHGPDRARGAAARPGVLAARALRRQDGPAAAAGAGPQAHRRGRHRPQHRRHGRVRARAGAVRGRRAVQDVRPARHRPLRRARHALRRSAVRRSDPDRRRAAPARVQLPLRRPRGPGRARPPRRRPGGARPRLHPRPARRQTIATASRRRLHRRRRRPRLPRQPGHRRPDHARRRPCRPRHHPIPHSHCLG